MSDIKKVAVVGAGVMGAGIAAQIANAGVNVLLLDIVPKGAKNRNVITEGAVQKLLKSNPAAFMHKRNAKRITTGNIDDNLKDIKTCDWIIEVVIERLDIKQNLYKKIEKYRKKTAVVSSNTSTLPLDVLTKGMPNTFCKHFLITHFFNPPRYMRLLEIVGGKDTSIKAIEKISEFCDRTLGKSVVNCHDKPGFIANRIGTYWLHAAVMTALKDNVGVEEADAVLSRPAGVPRTGVFGLLDLVGLDLMPHVLSSLMNALPKGDPFHELGAQPELLEKMIQKGYTGRKGKGGFYRLNDKRKKEALNLQTEKYSLAKRPKPEAMKASKKGGLRALLTHESKEGKYAWKVLSGTLAYAAMLVGEIADDIETIDRAMRLGYNWKFGPFELIDKIGTAWFVEKLQAQGREIPKILTVAKGRPLYRTHKGQLQFMTLKGTYQNVKRPKGVLLLQDIKRKSKPIFSNKSVSVWDIGNKVACLEFHSKMNSLNPLILYMVNKCVKKLPNLGYKALVLYNEGTNFSVGANIGLFLIGFKLRLWPAVRWLVSSGQRAVMNLKNAPFPVVGAPSGMALGGGCEMLLHCDAVEAHAETYIGLVEAGVGIIPGWGGCKELLGRAQESGTLPKGPMPAVMHAFQLIATAQVAKSADEAKSMLFFKKTDGIIMNRDRVLAAAKERALSMVKGYTPREPYIFHLPGASGKAALKLALNDFEKKGLATPHDVTVATELAQVLTGGDADVLDELTEQDILLLEQKAELILAKTKKTYARVMHMIKTGKPLRN